MSLSSQKRNIIFSLLFSLVISTLFLIYVIIASDSTLNSLLCLKFIPNNPRVAGYILAVLAYPAFFFLAYAIFTRLFGHYGSLSSIKEWQKLPLAFEKMSIVRTAVVLFVLWIPAMIIIFPGSTTGVDTINQIYQFLTPAPIWYSTMGTTVDASFIDHHPWFVSVLYGFFVWLGIQLGSASIGFFFFTLFQACIAAIVFGVSICYLSRLKTPYIIRFSLLIIVGIAPFFSVEILTMQKDSTFGIIFLAYAMMYLDIFITKGKHLSNKKWLILFAVIALLAILTKKTGVIVVLMSGIILLIAFRKEWKSLLIALGIPCFISLVCVPLVVFPLLNIAPGGKQEVLGPLYQQTVTLLKTDPHFYSDAELGQLDKVINLENAMNSYHPKRSDGVKSKQRRGVSGSDGAEYIKLWAKGALLRPDLYLKSLIMCSSELFIPSKNVDLNVELSQSGIEYFEERSNEAENPFELNASNPEPLNTLANNMKRFYRGTLCMYPPFSLVTTLGWYDFVLPLLALFAAFVYRKKEILFGLMPVWLTSAILVISPTAMSRYAVTSIFLTVVLIGALCWCMQKTNKGRHAK